MLRFRLTCVRLVNFNQLFWTVLNVWPKYFFLPEFVFTFHVVNMSVNHVEKCSLKFFHRLYKYFLNLIYIEICFGHSPKVIEMQSLRNSKVSSLNQNFLQEVEHSISNQVPIHCAKFQTQNYVQIINARHGTWNVKLYSHPF